MRYEKIKVERTAYKNRTSLIMAVFPAEKLVIENTAAGEGANTIDVVWPEGEKGFVIERTSHNRYYLDLASDISQAIMVLAKKVGEDPNKLMEKLISEGLKATISNGGPREQRSV